MSLAGRIIIVALMVTMLGCASKGSGTKEAKYGHWKFKGSSTFPQIFQCVQEFKPHQNKQCD